MLLKVPSKLPTVGMQADWLEASCLFGSNEAITRSEVKVALESSTDFTGNESDAIIEDAFGEIWRRKGLFKDYPMQISKDKIERSKGWRDVPAYSFMLLLATSHFYTGTMLTNTTRGIPAKLFEGLTTAALSNYLAAAVNIGWHFAVVCLNRLKIV